MSITTERNKPMTMKNPPHPGLVVLQECIEPSGRERLGNGNDFSAGHHELK